MKILSKLSIITVFLLVNFLSFPGEGKQTIDGTWFYYNDEGNKGTSKIIINNRETKDFSFIDEKINGVNKKVAELAGVVTTDFQYGFLGMGVNLPAKMLEELKKAKGIKFKAMGDMKDYRVRVETGDITDYDYYGKVFDASEKPAEVIIMFNKLTQEGWGKKAKFDPDKVTNITFQTVGQPLDSVLLKVWDFEFVE